MVPSGSSALPWWTVTIWPPRSKASPSGMPLARMESLTISALSPSSRKAARSTAGWMWKPSQISSPRTRLSSNIAPTTPGFRWWRPLMALNRWVAWVTPLSKAALAWS